MDLWFLIDPKLLTRERQAISALQESARWLKGAEWSFCGNKLCVNVTIKAHDHDYELRLIYPTLFPQVPPSVFPLNASARWSGHQYGGADGPLCLEWGPDNWNTAVTGAQMLESAFKLLDIENPLGLQEETQESAVVKIAPSRHELKPGQELRDKFSRFYLGNKTLEHLGELAAGAFGTLRFSTRLRNKSYLAVIHDLHPDGVSEIWNDSSIPKFFRGENDRNLRTGVFFKSDFSAAAVRAALNVVDLLNILQTSGYEAQTSIENNNLKIEGVKSDDSLGFLILDRDNNPHFFLLLDNGSAWKFARVGSDASRQVKRNPDNLRELFGKLIGIVGLGSAGSKIALSLARMGVRDFHLIDYDIFLPENVERNALDWGNLGEHKVDAVQEALLRLGVEFDIEISRADITGQESSASVSIILDRLGKCDLIIDATADPKVFNLMAAIASVYKKPLVWLEVYAGGIGGMIARSRPGVDPDPQIIRSAYLKFCERNPAPKNLRPKTANDYEAENDEGEVFTASDSDVAVIAHHAARLAADTVAAAEQTSYPYSMYLIGLTQAWIFEAPFATIPIATAHLLRHESEPVQNADAASANDNFKFIESILVKLDAANSSA